MRQDSHGFEESLPSPIAQATTCQTTQLSTTREIFFQEQPSPSDKGLKFDSAKPDYTLLDYDFIEDTIRVLTFGVQKYARDNWKKFTTSDLNRFCSAIMRHTVALIRGELLDPETGLPHAAHIAAEAQFIHYHEKPLLSPKPSSDTSIDAKACIKHVLYTDSWAEVESLR